MRDTCLRGFGPVGTNGRQYAEREVDSDELMPHYLRHVSAMTTEGLHAKSAIAAELAWRDAKVAELQARIAELEARYAASERDAVRLDWIGANAREIVWLGRPDACRVILGNGWNHERATVREAIDAAIDAHAQGQAGEEKDG